MKRKLMKFAAGSAAMIALAQPQIAMAQECVDQEDLADGVVYAMPHLYSAFTTKCAASISPNGFVATNGDTFIAKYSALHDQNWPAASRLLEKFGDRGGKSGGMGSMISNLPEEALRPFVDAIITQMVSDEIKVKDCGKIERAIESLAPLPAENMGSLAAFIADMAGVEKLSLCPHKPK